MVCEAINLDENSLPLYANMEHHDMIILVASLLTFYFVFVLVKFLHQVWWIPIRLQYKLKHQGITGPPYKFLHGNTKVVAKLRGESMGKPMDDFSHNIYSRIQPHVCLWTKIYGTNFINWHRSQPQLFVTDVELTKEIMTNKEDAYPKMEMQGYIKKVLGEALITNDGEKWAKIRKIANHFFHANSLKGMIPEMCASVETMLERWRVYVNKEIEVYKEFGMLATQVISTTAFGSTASEGRPIFEMVAKLTALTVRNEYKTRFPGFSRTSDEVEAEKLEKGIKTSILELVKIREQKFKNGETDDYGSDYLGQVVKIANDPDEKKRITYSQMIDEIKVLYGAGHLTTTTLLSWTVFLLAVHTDWQGTARKEVFEHFGKEKPTSDGIARLKNMNMIINECLRLYPPVVLLIRTVGREVKLGNLTLPPNINLFISVLALHHNPEIWGKDVDSFKPQRFAEGVAKATNNNAAAFIPFGMGSRTCVGLNFTTNEAKITLSMLLQRYKFSLSPNHVHHPADIFLLTPKNGVKVILQKV